MSFLCKEIARIQGLQILPNPILVVSLKQGVQSLQLLCMEWQRHQLIERILPHIPSPEERTRRRLELLYDLHRAMKAVSSPDSYRNLVRSMSADDIETMISAIQLCGELLWNASGPESSHPDCHGRFKGQGSAGWCSSVFAEVVVVKGIGFVAEVMIERSPTTLNELKDWKMPNGQSTIIRLREEQRWKEKLAILGVNAFYTIQ